jgi:hypothetical protein
MGSQRFAELANEILSCWKDGATFSECYPLLRELETMREFELGNLSWPGCKVWLENGEIVIATAHPTLDDFRDARFDSLKKLSDVDNAEICEHLTITIKAWLRELARRDAPKRDFRWYATQFNHLSERFLRASNSRLLRDAKQAGGVLVANAVRDGILEVTKPLHDECDLLNEMGVHETVRKPWLPSWVFEHAAITQGSAVEAMVFPRRACIDHTQEPEWESQKESSIAFCRELSDRLGQSETPKQTVAPEVVPVDPVVVDGLYEDEKLFVWGGIRYETLAPRMIRVLRLLLDERRKGFPDVSLDRIEKAQVCITGGMHNQVFKVNRKGWPIGELHPVNKVVLHVGSGVYRLIDPKKVPDKVPDCS